MKNGILAAVAVLTMVAGWGNAAFAAADFRRETAAERTQRMKWWTDARFGLFVHWGLYSLPARGEWVKTREQMSEERYRIYFDRFDPDLYDPREWARLAKAAGMRYMVLTTKHHDGFCLWDTATTDYKATNTSARRDLVRDYVDAARAEGLRVGLYYSIPDWHHPDGEINGFHPLRPKGRDPYIAKSAEENAELKRLNEGRDFSRFVRYMSDQLTELLTRYGKIDILWFDGDTKIDTVPLLELVRRIQPQVIVNVRLIGRKGVVGNDRWAFDFVTPEQMTPTQWPRWKATGEELPWEACHTFSGCWGYNRDEASWSTPEQLIKLLVETVALGGNLLMNVGPTARGELDARATESLGVYAKWMHANSRSIYGCTRAPADFVPPPNTLLTYNPERKRIYLHVLNYPKSGEMEFDFDDRVAYAQFLHDASEIGLVPHTDRGAPLYTEPKKSLGRLPGILRMPPVRPTDVVIPVVEMFLKD